MNPIFFRSQSESKTKPNLEKLHKLVKNENLVKKEDKIIKQNIPNNWIYNEKTSKQVWEDIEKSVKIESFEDPTIEKNPFKKIDESAARIRQTIANYEIQDQDLLMDLLNALDNESIVDNLDQENLLIEARTKLLDIITSHANNAEEQKNMLDSLRYWFADLQEGKTNDDPDFHNEKFNAQSLLDFLKKLNKEKEESVENVINIHSDIVSMLTNRINEIQKTLNQKEFLLSKESDKNSNTNKAKKGRRGFNRDSIDFDKEMVIAQRKIVELQSQVTSLKQALIEYSKPTTDGQSKPSIAPLISLEKEFELDQKITVLTEEIKSLKNNNKFLQTQIGKDKQNELVLENKLSNAEKAKKAMEQKVQSMNQKIEQMENVYQEKIKAIKNEALISKEMDGNATLAESQKYQKKIQEMNQMHQEAISSMMKENERRFRQQMKELTSAYESGDQSKILSSTVENYNNELKNIREQSENQLQAQKTLFSSQLMELSKNYEKIIARKDKEKEIIKDSIESTLKAAELTSKMNFEDEERKKIFELNEKHNEELVFMRVEFTKKIEDLRRKLDRAVHERDSLRNLIETSTVATLLDDLNFDEDMDEEEEEEDKKEDDILFKSLLVIKQREIEKNITDKYMNIIDNQNKILKDSFNWEIAHSKLYFQTEIENCLSDFREKTVAKIQELYKKIPESETTLEDLLTTIIKQISNNEQTILSQSMIPLNEVENKLDELRLKLIDFESENHVFKRMFEKLGTGYSSSQKEDIFKAFCESLKEKSEEQIVSAEDKNPLSRQATEVKITPSSSTVSEIQVPKEDEVKKKPIQKSPSRRRPRMSITMPRVIIHYHSASNQSINISKSQSQFTEPLKNDENSISRNMNSPKRRIHKVNSALTFDKYQETVSSEHSDELLKKVKDAEDDAIEMRKIFIEYSLKIINLMKKGTRHSKGANDTSEKNRKIKYETCFDISEKISHYNIAPEGDLKMCNTDILERLKDREIHPPDPDQIIDQVRSLLMQLSNVHLRFTPRNSQQEEMQNNSIIAIEPVSNNINTEVIKKLHSHLSKEVKEDIKPLFLLIAENAKKLVEEHKSIIKKLKDSYVELSKKSANENVRNKQLMEETKSQLDKEREENRINKETIRKNHAVIETLESKLNDSISRLQQIALQNEIQQRNIDAFNQIEEEGKQSIDSMTEMMLKLREIIHQQEKEIDKLNLKNQSLEAAIELFNTGRNCKLSRDFPITILHYPETDDELLFGNNVSIPQLAGVSNLSKDFSSPNSSKMLTPGSVKSERIRCRVTNNGNNNTSRPQSAVRVFVPAKSKATIAKTPRSNAIPTVDVQPLYAENYEPVTNKENDDGNSSIVVYVTPFIKEKHQIPKGTPGLLPANINNPNQPNDLSNANVSSIGNTNPISNSSFFTIHPGKTAAISLNNEGNSSQYLVSEKLPLKENEVNTSYFKQLELHIRSLEKQLLDMQNKYHLEKDKTHEANQALFKAGVQNQKAVREIRKQMIYKENAVKGMTKAISMVSERDRKILLLTEKINKFNKIASSISDKIEAHEKEKRSEELNAISRGSNRNGPKRTLLLYDDPKVEEIYERIMKSLNNNQLFSTMAQNEMKSIVRIHKLRKKAIEDEHNKIIGALDAMCFLTQPPMRPASSVKVTTTPRSKPKTKKSLYLPKSKYC